VRLWSACTDDFQEAEYTALAAVLDLDELARCGQLQQEADRRAFILAHALRRMALAEALDSDPREIRFTASAQDKPALAWPHDPALSFSLSHARQAVVCAVSRGGEVGVDAEYVQGEPDFGLLDSFVVVPPAPQRAEHAGADPAGQFFFYWTALEAFWKSHGVGLQAAHPRIRLRRAQAGTFDAAFEHDGEDVRRARLVSLPPRGGCAITLALRDTAARSQFSLAAGNGPGDVFPTPVRRPARSRRNVV
jgi:phosphopantetheinyl transferase